MKFLTVASDLDIFEIDPESEEYITYLSRVEEIREESILITPPFIKGNYSQLLPAEIGKVFNMRVTVPGCSYFFECQLIEFSEKSNTLWELSLPTHFRRIQKRDHVRLTIYLEIKIEFMEEKKKTVKTFTKDISAGGVQVVLEEPLPEDVDISIFLPLTDEFAIEAKGEIVRVTVPKTPRGMLRTALKFSEISKAQQEEITKYIFNREVQRRQKDKILFGKSIR